jgi:hypothetical protein
MSDQTKKQDAGKPQLGLIPRNAMIDLAAALEVGRRKYGAHAWRKNPMEWSRVIDAMLRHAFAFAEGEDLDPQDGQPHLGAIMACAAFLSEYSRTNPEGDDRHKAVETKTVIKEVEVTEAGRAELRRNTSKTTRCSPIGFGCDRCGARAYRPCLATDFGRGA